MYRLDILNQPIERTVGRVAVLELAILGLLYEAPVHGYELRKQLSTRLGGLRVISYGSLYPALRRLTRAGLIRQERQSRSLIYRADYAAMNDLVGYLMENCCGGAACASAATCTPPTPQRKSA